MLWRSALERHRHPAGRNYKPTNPCFIPAYLPARKFLQALTTVLTGRDASCRLMFRAPAP